MRHWDKPPPRDPYGRDPWEYSREKDQWLREQQEREKREMLEILRNQFIRPRPEPAPIVRGDYLVYYLGGPLNCTQEYFWDKQMPKDRALRDVPDPVTSLTQSPDNPAAHQLTVRVNRYMLVMIPKNETPFSTVQVYLALYQEPPL